MIFAMLYIYIYVGIIAIIFGMHSSEAAICTSTSFEQALSATDIAATKIIAANYAANTKRQIIAKLLREFGEHVTRIDYTVTQKRNAVNIKYNVIFACNKTTKTVSSNGRIKQLRLTSKVDKHRVEKSILAGF